MIFLLYWISVFGVMNTQKVWLKYELRGSSIRMECYVDTLTNSIDIRGPDTYSVGYFCSPPIRVNGTLKGSCQGQNLTQDLKTNITSLYINITNTTTVSGTWTCEHGTNTGSDSVEIDIWNWKSFSMTSKESCKSICLKYTVTSDLQKVRLLCNVDNLEHKIIFKQPNGKVFGQCLSPNLKLKQPGKCDESMYQDIKTKTTTAEFQLSKQTLNGLWTCQHGEADENDVVHVEVWEQNVCETPIGIIVCCGVFALLSVTLLAFMMIYFRIPYKIFRGIYSFRNGYHRLSSHDYTASMCEMCKFPTVCAFCIDCEKLLCQICCNQHTDTCGDNIAELDHPSIMSSENRLKCVKCKYFANHICLECKNLFCQKCNCQHSRKSACNFISRSLKNISRRQEITFASQSKSKLDLHTKIDLGKNIRVIGVSILSKGRIVIADYTNKRLVLFKHSEQEKEKNLEYEPRGMTGLFDDRIAITIAELKLIRVYDIVSENTKVYFKVQKEILTSEFGRPYKIAFNDDHYVVEIGKSENGALMIFHVDGTKLKTILLENEGVHFNGETMRVALHWRKRLIFVTAIDMKKVLCLHFEEDTERIKNSEADLKWKQNISSPRSILYVPSGKNNNILLASKRFNTLYRMDSRNGQYDILNLPDGVTGPRYLAYHIDTKVLVLTADQGICMFRFNMQN